MASKPVAHRIGKKWRSEDVKLQEVADFTSLLLSDSVLAGLEKSGFKTPSPIQLEAIPVGRFGKDLVVQAKSGTGKTLVFTIVALEMLLDVKHPQVLILAPTREIAFQICSVIQAVGSEFKDLKCCTFIGGTSINEDKNHAHSCQIAVGTPGRIKQLTNLGILKTNSIRLFVLDEADQLLTESFQNDVDAIFLTLPKDKQVIATSATYPKKLKKLVNRYFRKPYLARLSVNELALLGIVHYIYLVDTTDMVVLAYKQKLKCLERILTTVTFSQCLVFCNMVSRVQQLSLSIKEWGFSTAYISSAKEQSERLKAIDNLKRFKCKVLVTSDLTSRGIDAENVDLVINFDAPNYTEVYLHRSGRAGRYGSKGVSITFVNEKELKSFKAVEDSGSFKSYDLPDPIPPNLISIRPQDFYQKAVCEGISSDTSDEQVAEDSVQKENNVDNIDEANEDISEKSNPQISVPNEAMKSGAEESIDQNVDSTLSHFEVKLPRIEINPEPLSLKNLVELPDSSTASATNQSFSEKDKEPETKLEDIFANVVRTFLKEPMAGNKLKEEREIKSVRAATKQEKNKLNPEDKIDDICKTNKHSDDSLIQNLSCIEHTKESSDENFREMHSTLSNFIAHHEKNLVTTLAKDLSSKCNIDSQDAPSSDVITDESSSKKSVCAKDIAQFRNGLNNYYYTVFKSYTNECVPNNPHPNVTEKVDETENVNIPVGKIHTDSKLLFENHPNVDECDSDEETESSSEIESYLESASAPQKGEVIFAAKSTDEPSGSSSSGSSSSDYKASSPLVLSKKLSQSIEETESTSIILSPKESTPKREVIYTAKSTDKSSDSSDSSSLDSEPQKSVLLLRQKFKEVVQESYKKQPPKNNGCMPKLSKTVCKQFSQSANKHSDVAQGAVFISSSGSSSSSETSWKASSESSSDVETQMPKQIRRNTSSTYSESTNTSKHSFKSRGSKKSQPSRRESCNLTKSHDVYQNNRHRSNNSVSRSNRGTSHAVHGNFQSTRDSHLNRSQYNNQLPYNCDINDPRSHWGAYNTGNGNLQSTNQMGNSHCYSQPVNQQSYTCTQSCPNQGHVSHESLNYQPHIYNQWYEIFQKQWQCIHYSTYFR